MDEDIKKEERIRIRRTKKKWKSIGLHTIKLVVKYCYRNCYEFFFNFIHLHYILLTFQNLI